jgi:thiamine-phosphate pyrophosphorylase
MKLLYVTDRAAVGDARLAEILDALADAPELTVELREKAVSDREYLALAAAARARLAPSVPLYVNRRFDVALAARASGVHLPADGIPAPRVRANTPRGFRVGVSTHSPEEAAGAIAAGADLVLIDPIFDTPSKRAFGPPLGPATLGRLPDRSSHHCEVFAIGGMDLARLPELETHRDRISGIAAVRLIQESADPRAVAEELAAR